MEAYNILKRDLGLDLYQRLVRQHAATRQMSSNYKMELKETSEDEDRYEFEDFRYYSRAHRVRGSGIRWNVLSTELTVQQRRRKERDLTAELKEAHILKMQADPSGGGFQLQDMFGSVKSSLPCPIDRF